MNRALGRLGWAAGGVTAAVGAGILVAEYSFSAVAVIAALCVSVLSLVWGPVLPVIAVPASWFGDRLPLGGGVLSISDAFLALGCLSAVPTIDWSRTRLRGVVIPACVFAGASGLALLNAPTTYALVEWAHRLGMVVGAAVLGAALLRVGKLELAIKMLLALSAVYAVESLRLRVIDPSLPAYPFGANKNAAGSLMVACILILQLWPGGFQWPRKLRWPLLVLLVLGILATGSRGAVTAGAAVLGMVYAIRSRSPLAVAGLTVLCVGVVGYEVLHGLDLAQQELTDARISSPDILRLTLLREALATWERSPLLGSGILVYRSVGVLNIDPHDVIVLTLEESGIVGLAGLAALLLGSTLYAVRRGNPLATLAVALVAARFMHGLVDVFWVHGTLPLPWMLMGAALGGSMTAAPAAQSVGSAVLRGASEPA